MSQRLAGSPFSWFLCICLVLSVTLASAAGITGSPRDLSASEELPSRYIHFTAAELGALYWPPQAGAQVRLLRVDYHSGRLRLGIAAAEIYMVFLYESGGAIAPVSLGWDLYSRPRPTAFFCGMVPSIRVELAGGYAGPDGGVTARAAVVGEVDYYGLGAGLELGALTMRTIEADHAYEPPRRWTFYGVFKLRGLAFSIGL